MSQAIDSVTGALQGLQFSSSESKAADIQIDVDSPKNNRSGLLTLPNELLIQVAEHLTASKCGGIIAGSTQDLTHLALVCKRLVPITNTVLYRSVTLQAPDRHMSRKGPRQCVLPQFLRTILRHPRLGACVEEITLYFVKGKPVHPQGPVKKEGMCTCGDCAKMLSITLHSMRLTLDENIAWQKDLSHPTEAMVCGLILASLPNLRSVELHSEKLRKIDHLHGSNARIQARSDVDRLGHGLIGTKVQTISLSDALNGLRLSRLPNLTRLIVDFTGSNRYIWADRTLANITALTIKGPVKDMDEAIFEIELDMLLQYLPNLRSLEFESRLIAKLRRIPRHVDTVIFRPADGDFLHWVQSELNAPAGPTKLRSIVLHWEKDKPALDAMAPHFGCVQELVEKTGVRVTIMWRDTVWKTMYKTGTGF